MKKVCLALACGVLVPVIGHAQFADAVISYAPGTGIAAGYTNASAALGAPALGGSITPFAPPFSKTQLVSIGAGGEITLQLDTPISNAPSSPFGIDFILFANQFFVSGGGNVSGLFYHAASTLVQVSADDSIWYTLNPSLASQPGELFPTDGSGNPLIPVNPSLTLANFTGQNLAGIRSLYGGSAGGTGYSLAWAQDANSNSVVVASADYVRIEVQSGVVDLDAISVVPEPGAWALISVGVVLCWLLRQTKEHWKIITASLNLNLRGDRSASLPLPFRRGEGRGEGSVSSIRVRTDPKGRFMGKSPMVFKLCSPHPSPLPALAGRGSGRKCQDARHPFSLRLCLWLLAGIVLAPQITRAQYTTNITENFATDPLQNGWRVFGDTNLFQWDSTNQVLDVTWDSSQTNCYFYYPLAEYLTRNDDFRIEFDLNLSDIASGVQPGTTGAMELAFGFLHLADATNANFMRGAGYGAAPNLAEFDYFAYGYYYYDGANHPSPATTTPAFTPGTNSTDFAPVDYTPYDNELPLNQTVHVLMAYTASNQTATVLLTTNGVMQSQLPALVLNPNNGFADSDDFQVDAFSISSYSNAGDPYDSVLAHGSVANIVVTLPPPVQNLAGDFTNGVWQVQFASRINWSYSLIRTTNFVSWNNVSAPMPGNGTNLVLQDQSAPADKAFYRVQANRP